jgi:nicotinamide-nucleotide amidase
MTAEIISVGTELLLGQIHDTDATYLSQELAKVGVDVFYRTTVGDNTGRMGEVLRSALERSEVVIVVGGLGPTSDDLTREVIADVLGLPLVEDAEAVQTITEFFRDRGVAMAPSNLRQAMVPAGGQALANDAGTAPGVMVQKDGKTVFALPGPPHEMERMAQRHLIPRLKSLRTQEEGIFSRVLHLSGIGESAAAREVEDLLASSNPTVAPLATGGVVNLRITTKAGTPADALREIERMEREVRSRLSDYVFGADEETMQSVVGGLLRAKRLTIATAESCTAGLLSARLTEVSGSSDYYLSSVVAYSNEAKVRLLGVRRETLEKYGAVSEEVAIEMAEGVREAHGADIGVSCTGIAGPTGGSEEKPVGLVFIGICEGAGSEAKRFQFRGGRSQVRERAVQAALDLLWRKLR